MVRMCNFASEIYCITHFPSRELTSLLSTFGGVEGETCHSFSIRNKAELSSLLDDEKFGNAEVIQLVEVFMDKLDAPEALKRGAELSKAANAYAPT